jgi:hypothetical protein
MKNLITKKGRLSKTAIKSIQKIGFTLWLQDSRDDKTSLSIVLNYITKDGIEIDQKPDSRGDAHSMAVWTYDIRNNDGLDLLDYDFIAAFGSRADVY